jgi:hypothetical protein
MFIIHQQCQICQAFSSTVLVENVETKLMHLIFFAAPEAEQCKLRAVLLAKVQALRQSHGLYLGKDRMDRAKV